MDEIREAIGNALSAEAVVAALAKVGEYYTANSMAWEAAKVAALQRARELDESR